MSPTEARPVDKDWLMTIAPTPLPAEPSYRNELEIQFFGLQRSGNHAVLSWMFQQFDDPVFFFNNVTHFEDPILNFHFARLPNTVTVSRGPPPGASGHGLVQAGVQQHLEEIRSRKKHVLVYSYENLPLAKLPTRALVGERERHLGVSARTHRVLLLRDFYNWIASRLRLFENKGQALPPARRIAGLVALWLTYAREYADETRFLLGEEVIKISYNRWAEDENYRACLLNQLSIPIKDNSNGHVPDVGGGSSFDGMLPGGSKNMQLGERWRYLLEDKFAGLFDLVQQRLEEVERYNLLIFGLSSPFRQNSF